MTPTTPSPGGLSPDTVLGRVVLLVLDYDEALAFYRAALGAEPIFDRTTDAGQRFLHVALPGQAGPDEAPPQVGLWFLAAAGEERSLVGRQAGGHPFLVLYTPDLRSALQRFTGAGGELRHPEREDAGARFAHVADLYGNELVLVQLPT